MPDTPLRVKAFDKGPPVFSVICCFFCVMPFVFQPVEGCFKTPFARCSLAVLFSSPLEDSMSKLVWFLQCMSDPYSSIPLLKKTRKLTKKIPTLSSHSLSATSHICLLLSLVTLMAAQTASCCQSNAGTDVAVRTAEMNMSVKKTSFCSFLIYF